MDESKYNVSDEEMASLIKALDEMLDEEPGFYGELKPCAWNVLHENPGIDMDEWIDILMRQYPTEVVDAIGSHPAETYASLCEMWQDEYTDPETGECNTFWQWAKKFSSYSAIDRYDKAAEQEAILRHLQARQSPKQ